MVNVLVTNGMINQEPFDELLKHIDAANIDLKSFSRSFYKTHGGDFETVKASIKIASRKIHLEITTLIIEGVNDAENEFEQECAWLCSIDNNIPLHLTRFYPRHLFSNNPPTGADTVKHLKTIADKYLRRVVAHG
jgi:pyruvate formate lyase activating enzyme